MLNRLRRFFWKQRRLEVDTIPDHERPLGRIFADVHGAPFQPLRSLEEAKGASDGVVILQGDDGGQIYLVCHASQVRCSEDALRVLLRELDEIAWPGNYENSRDVFFERMALGTGVAGGMGGGRVTSEPWIHGEFIQRNLRDPILAVLRGDRSSLGK